MMPLARSLGPMGRGYGAVDTSIGWIIAQNGADPVSSSDGAGWTPTAVGILTSTGSNAVAYNGSMWVITGKDNVSPTTPIAYSSDGGKTWGTVEKTASELLYGYCVAWNGSYWLLGGYSSAGYGRLMKSSDGITWDIVNLSPVVCTEVSGLAWNGSYWIMTMTGTNKLAKSVDGINWTALSGPPTNKFVTGGFCVAWNGSYWLAGGGASYSYTKIIKSDDGGSTWSIVYTGNTVQSCYSVAWNGSYWIAGMSTGAPKSILKSSDGISWSPISVPITGVRGVAWNGSYWIVTGGTSIYKSSNGINWNASGTITGTGGQGVASNPAPNLYPPR